MESQGMNCARKDNASLTLFLSIIQLETAVDIGFTPKSPAHFVNGFNVVSKRALIKVIIFQMLHRKVFCIEFVHAAFTTLQIDFICGCN